MGIEWEEEYRGMMERECFSRGEKENIIGKLVQSAAGEGAENGYVPGRNFRAGRFGVKGAVAACLIGCLFLTGVTGAGAAGLLKPVSDAFAKVFHLAGNDDKLAERMGKSLGKSAVSNGIRITADAVISDSYAYAVVFSIEREDGKPLGAGKKLAPDQWDFDNTSVEMASETEGSSTWGEFYSYDETVEDDAVQYVMMAYGIDKLKPGDSISVRLSDLYHLSADGSKDYMAEGDWNMELSFPESSDNVIEIGKKEAVQLDGSEFTIEEIMLSPISYHLAFSIRENDGLSAGDGAKILENSTMELEFRDGRKFKLGGGGSAVKSSGIRIQFVYGDTFNTLVHPEDIKAVHIGALKIPVN